MKKYIILTLFLSSFTLLITGCAKENGKPDTEQNPTITASAKPSKELSQLGSEAIREKISAVDAKEMMDSIDNLIILDVRTQEEFEEGYIEGAILIPDYEIESKAEELLQDKNTTILLYCRSGRRSALASQTLSDLGYNSIYDFGGIIDWPYEVITD